VGVEQLSIFLENKSGGLADVVDVLARRGVNLRALSLADEADFGILRLIVDDTEAALAALKEAGAVARRTSVVAVEVPDRPGGLSAVLAALHAAAINVEYMYAFPVKAGAGAIVVFRFDDEPAALAALGAAGARVLEAGDVRQA
jgi:hypothetical protein